MSNERAANLLLVEGEDDKHVVRHLCRRLALDLKFGCFVAGGKDALLDAIRVTVKQHGRQAIGVLLDADDDIAGRWQAVRDRLRDTTITLPSPLRPDGVVVRGDPSIHLKPRFGVWLMPDNQHAGELEDFVIQLLPDDDPVWPLAERFVDDIPQEQRKFRRQKARRAKLYAWLATRREPMKMGAAIGAGSLGSARPAAKALADWLTALFGPIGTR